MDDPVIDKRSDAIARSHRIHMCTHDRRITRDRSRKICAYIKSIGAKTFPGFVGLYFQSKYFKILNQLFPHRFFILCLTVDHNIIKECVEQSLLIYHGITPPVLHAKYRHFVLLHHNFVFLF